MNNGRIPRMVFIWEYNLGLNNWCQKLNKKCGDINCNDIFNYITECNWKECGNKLFNGI